MYLEDTKTRLEELRIVRKEAFLPCTGVEVHALERQLGVILPGAYKEFLLWMGHGAGRFLQGSDCFYEQLPSLKEWAIELLKENRFPQPIPDDAFVFFMHQGYQFNFMRTSEGEDPPVYFYGEWTGQTDFRKNYTSFSKFLIAEIDGHVNPNQNRP